MDNVESIMFFKVSNIESYLRFMKVWIMGKVMWVYLGINKVKSNIRLRRLSVKQEVMLVIWELGWSK